MYYYNVLTLHRTIAHWSSEIIFPQPWTFYVGLIKYKFIWTPFPVILPQSGPLYYQQEFCIMILLLPLKAWWYIFASYAYYMSTIVWKRSNVKMLSFYKIPHRFRSQWSGEGRSKEQLWVHSSQNGFISFNDFIKTYLTRMTHQPEAVLHEVLPYTTTQFIHMVTKNQ